MRMINRTLSTALLAAMSAQIVLAPLPRWGLSVAHAADEEAPSRTGRKYRARPSRCPMG